MNNLGIIAEYNPFHNGHLYHLQESKKISKADNVIVIMSGNFVQRGEPAFLNKWARSEIAIKCGADLVLELPFAFACNNAEYFAEGAISMLDRLGCINTISFGSEAGDVKLLRKIATSISDKEEEFNIIVREKLDKGTPYPKATAEAVSKISGMDENEISLPNNMLSIEYLKQLIKRRSEIKTITVARDGVTSATNVRMLHKIGKDVSQWIPNTTLDIINRSDSKINLEINDLDKSIYTSLLRSNSIEISKAFAAGEGIENRILRNIRTSKDIDQLIQIVKGGRYTSSRIKRILLHHLMGLTKDIFSEIRENQLMYGRVLAFSPKGAKLLKEIKKTKCCDYPIVTNINKEKDSIQKVNLLFDIDVRATDLYNLTAQADLYKDSDFVHHIFFEKI